MRRVWLGLFCIKPSLLQEEFKPLTKWWKTLLGADVTQVRVSRRLAKTPAIVVAGQYGYSANLEKVMRSQAVSDNPQQQMMLKMKDRVLEVNPKHPLVEELKNRVSHYLVWWFCMQYSLAKAPSVQL